MIYLQNINLPVLIEYIDFDQINISDICKPYNLYFSNAIILTGQKYSLSYAKKIFHQNEQLIGALVDNIQNTKEQVEDLRKILLDSNHDLIIAVGGGRVLDTAKSLAFLSNINYLAIPTQISTDALASPISILKNKGREKAYTSQIPMGIGIDLDVLSEGSPKHILAGIGDLYANESALLDWQLAIKYGKASPNPFAEILSKKAFENLRNTEKLFSPPFLKLFTESIILAGQAMSISGTSRPCSGSEHLIAHALDHLGNQHAHGFTVGSTTPFCLFLHKVLNKEKISYFEKLQFSLNFTELIPNKHKTEEIFDLAKKVRGDRYTILNEFTNAELSSKYQEFINEWVQKESL